MYLKNTNIPVPRNYINNDHSIIKVDTSFAGTEIK